ncbi:hypothetical protein FRC11_013415, partial [Ceratobasidium sp. 423]
LFPARQEQCNCFLPDRNLPDVLNPTRNLLEVLNWFETKCGFPDDPEPQMTLYLQRIEALCICRAELERAGVIDPRKRHYRPEGDLSSAEIQALAETDGYSNQEDNDDEEPAEE